jgi:transposase
MHWLQRSTLKSARAWRLKMALREVYARARSHNSIEQAGKDLSAWLSWARRCRLAPFKKLATTLKEPRVRHSCRIFEQFSPPELR